MKRRFFSKFAASAAAIALMGGAARAQSPTYPSPTFSAVSIAIANASSTGTTLNKLAKLTGAPSAAVIATTSDTTGILGVVMGGAGTTGSAQVTVQGQASCVFDGATTAGDYVQASSTTGGDCHDAGATLPASGDVLGRVLSTNGGGGTYAMLMFPPEQRGQPALGAGVAAALGNAANASGGFPTAPVANAQLANPATTVAGQTCTLGSTCGLNNMTAALGADVNLNNAVSFFDGPCAIINGGGTCGTAGSASGTWSVRGGVSLIDTGGTATFTCKLWDGATVIEEQSITASVSTLTFIRLGGLITTPAGNLKISCNDTLTTGKIVHNTGSNNSATIAAFRIN